MNVCPFCKYKLSIQINNCCITIWMNWHQKKWWWFFRLIDFFFWERERGKKIFSSIMIINRIPIWMKLIFEWFFFLVILINDRRMKKKFPISKIISNLKWDFQWFFLSACCWRWWVMIIQKLHARSYWWLCSMCEWHNISRSSGL